MTVMSLEELAAGQVERRGRKVVHCHGCFDVLHAGHVRHLHEAWKLGDLLVVTVTSDRFVDKGPGRPAFSQDYRAEVLDALWCVGVVAVCDHPTAVEAIRAVRPSVFAKGEDYAYHKTRRLAEEEQAVLACGGRLVYTRTGILFSSTSAIQRLEGGPCPTTSS